MGIDHPVRNFDGRVIAIVKRHGGKGIVWVVAPKSTRFIVNDIKKAKESKKGCAVSEKIYIFVFCLRERAVI